MTHTEEGEMSGLVLGSIVVLLFLSATALLALTRAPQPTGTAARPWLRRMRWRVWSGLGAVVVVAGVLVWIGLWRSGLLGLPLAVAPGAGAVAGLLVVAAVPDLRAQVNGPRAASLVARRPWSYVRPPRLVRLAATAALTVLVLVATGLSSATDDNGRHRLVALQQGDLVSSHGPYPGWWYGGPLILTTVALCGAVWFALIAVARWSAPPVPALQAGDRALRRTATSVITGLGSAALLAQLGAILAFAGDGLIGVASAIGANGLPMAYGPLILGWVASLGGVVAMGAGVVSAGGAAAAALRSPVAPATVDSTVDSTVPL